MLECGHIVCLDCIIEYNMTYKDCKICNSAENQGPEHKHGEHLNPFHKTSRGHKDHQIDMKEKLTPQKYEDFENLKNVFTIESTPQKDHLTTGDDSVQVISISNIKDEFFKKLQTSPLVSPLILSKTKINSYERKPESHFKISNVN